MVEVQYILFPSFNLKFWRFIHVVACICNFFLSCWEILGFQFVLWKKSYIQVLIDLYFYLLRVEIAGSYIKWMLDFIRKSPGVPEWSYFTFLPVVCENSCCPYPIQHLVHLIFLILAILVGVVYFTFLRGLLAIFISLGCIFRFLPYKLGYLFS